MPVVVMSPYNVAAFPRGGGHFWVYLQYALGLRRLGCDVYWLEAFRTKGREEHEAAALEVFRARMQKYGFDGKVILYATRSKKAPPGAPVEYLTTTRADAEAVFEAADLLLNFHYAISPGLLACFRRTALVDIDPGLLQFWISRGQLTVPPHDLYFTIGEGVRDRDIHWARFRPPICLEHWPCVFAPCCETFTTISNWDSGEWVTDGAATYENTKRVAFLEFANLPRLTGQSIELALCGRTERDWAEWTELEQRGWRIRHAAEVAASPEMYQAYIQGSRGEFSCARPSYVRFQNAWISDRTLCYLASGKPVVVQHSGPSAFLPDGEGMFRFTTLTEAADAFAAINADYEGHCQAAREIARAHFDATRTLERVLTIALSHSERVCRR